MGYKSLLCLRNEDGPRGIPGRVWLGVDVFSLSADLAPHSIYIMTTAPKGDVVRSFSSKRNADCSPAAGIECTNYTYYLNP